MKLEFKEAVAAYEDMKYHEKHWRWPNGNKTPVWAKKLEEQFGLGINVPTGKLMILEKICGAFYTKLKAASVAQKIGRSER